MGVHSALCLLLVILGIILIVGAQNVNVGIPPQMVPQTTPDRYDKPPAENWIRDYTTHNRQQPYRPELADWLISGCWGTDCPAASTQNRVVEYEGYDGWYNNPARPDLGAIDTPLLRRVPAVYSDGSYAPSGGDRPNPLELSDQILSGAIGSQSRTGKNALLVFFGQQTVEEILDAQRAACPPEYFNIPIPQGHRYREQAPKHTQLPLLRTRYDASTGFSPNNPRQQLNEITPYLDGGLVYGSTKAWSDFLRTYENGTVDENGLLAYSHGGLFPEYNTARLPMANPPPPAKHGEQILQHELKNVNRFFRLGNPRGNENTFLLTFGVLWFRWHNYLATALRRKYPHWQGEKVYNEARRWVIATQQHIVMYRWLPEWLGVELPNYREYNPSVDPQIDQFFQAAAMRFGHTLVTPGVYLRDFGRNNCSFYFSQWGRRAVRTCNAFWLPQDAILTNYSDHEVMDIDRLLMGMALQRCEEEDHKIVEDLRGNVFGPLEFSRRDLMAVNIQRARDHGLPGFNVARAAYGLPPVTNATAHYRRVDAEIIRRLRRLHKAPQDGSGDKEMFDNMDIWVAGIMETEDGPGELFRTVIRDQFERIRSGDRFWFESRKNGLFTTNEVRRLRQLEIYDIIMAVTRMDRNDIPLNPFSVPLNSTEIHPNCLPQVEISVCSRLPFTRGNPSSQIFNYNCSHLPALDANRLAENCTDPGTYDYFYNSETSYILTWLGIGTTLAAMGGAVIFFSKIEAKKRAEINVKLQDTVRRSMKRVHGSGDAMSNATFPVKEWQGPRSPTTSIVVVLNSEQKRIEVMTQRGTLVRAIDFSASNRLIVITTTDRSHTLLRVAHEYDLVFQFDSAYLCETFTQALERFTELVGVERERVYMGLKPMLKQAVTKADRQKQLDSFFRVVFAQAFHIGHDETEVRSVDSRLAREVIYTELTLSEFGEALAMRPDSEFVRRIFTLIDRDRNGFVSFREFLDLLFIFAKGGARERAKLLFDMYDINGTGYLSEQDFRDMISSLMDNVHATVRQEDLDRTLATIKRSRAGAGISFDDFFELFKDDIELVGNVNIEFGGRGAEQRGPGHLGEAEEALETLYEDPNELKARIAGASSAQVGSKVDEEQEKVMSGPPVVPKRPGRPLESHSPTIWHTFVRYIQSNNRELFWAAMYTLVLLSVFAERAYYYSVEREHSGLRRIAGYGVTVTRGAASAMMFTYSSLLITMCRNLLTFLRETPLNHYIPFDSSVALHKYIACWALLFTIIHIIGHSFNFYHISTQTADDLTCLFRNYFRATHILPKFHYWCWETITGFTGVLLTLTLGAIFICAIPGVSRRLFWHAHSLYPLVYVFSILHGCGRLIQPPFFGNFLAGPLFLFVIDSLVSARRRRVQIRVLKAELLPSGVTKLEFKRPTDFQYKSGQWVRIACLGLGSTEFHPFTLSSAPHEPTLTVHIRSVGPWTYAIRDVYDPGLLPPDGGLPAIHLDGPYGEGHQDWDRYDISVLVGGGIGVTPFASILKDIVFRANHLAQANKSGGDGTIKTKVYFIWVTRTQKQFEWLVDILRELEVADIASVVSVHLFITQFYHKFDLRTTLLYICERYFQRVSGGRSLFTGLKAVTHFGRPKFSQFLRSLQTIHPEARSAGVFSCGPPPMTNAVEAACSKVNRFTHGGTVTFQHHYKNF